jgi:hypothetical protein
VKLIGIAAGIVFFFMIAKFTFQDVWDENRHEAPSTSADLEHHAWSDHNSPQAQGTDAPIPQSIAHSDHPPSEVSQSVTSRINTGDRVIVTLVTPIAFELDLAKRLWLEDDSNSTAVTMT